MPGLNEIQDAYVIAVEEQARQRLEQLSVLHKVRPVDIASVGTNFATNNNTSASANNGSGVGPTYVAQAVRAGGGGGYNHNCFIPEVSRSELLAGGPAQRAARPSPPGAAGSVESVASTSGVSGSSETEGSLSETMDTGGGVANGYLNGHGGTNGGMLQDGGSGAGGYPMNGALKEANRLAAGGGVRAGGVSNKLYYGNDPQYPPQQPHDRQRSKENLYDSDTTDPGAAEPSSPPHREMAIDCPANFVGKVKEPPRLPANSQLNRGSPRSSGTSTPVKGSGRAMRNWEENITPYSEAPAPTAKEQLANEERIRHYQEEVRRQREEKKRLAQEEEFLRTSLRGSKKLQALEEPRAEGVAPRVPPSGIVNPNFITEEDADGYDGASRASTLALGSREQVPFNPTGAYSFHVLLIHHCSCL